MKTKVMWTTREWDLIASEFIKEGQSVDDYGCSSLIRKAMEKHLPKERWRALSGILPGARGPLEHAIQLGKRAQPPTAPKQEPVQQQVSAHELSLEDLLVELAKRFAKLLGPVVMAEPKQYPVDRAFYPPPDVLCVNKPDPRKPRILVVGPRNGQQLELIGSHQALDLRFVASDEGPSRIDAVGIHCDEIVLWTNYINHQHRAHAKATNRPTYYVSGGLSSIHERLSLWEKT